VLRAELGVYGLTGAAAGLLANRVLSLGPGSYLITGVDGTLQFGELPTQTRARGILVQAPSCAVAVHVSAVSRAIEVEVITPSGARRIKVY
jgi:hypothetical protein